MADRDGEYVLVRKSKKSRDVYYDDDDDDEDDYSFLPRRRGRGRYVSNEEIDPDYRRQFSDVREQYIWNEKKTFLLMFCFSSI